MCGKHYKEMEDNSRIITRRVINYSDIPVVYSQNCWISQYPKGCYVEVHLADEPEDDFDKWLMEKYPGIEEDTFLIDMN